MSHGWSHIPLLPSRVIDVPESPGVYAIVRIARVLGFPVNIELLYIGQSVQLRRRYREHALWRLEHNRNLSADLGRSFREFWFMAAAADKLDEIERELIREARPSANIVQYRRTDHE